MRAIISSSIVHLFINKKKFTWNVAYGQNFIVLKQCATLYCELRLK